MADPSPFANTSRIGVDSCNTDQRSLQNTHATNYMLQNFFLAECGMKKPIEFATSQPAVNFKGGHLGAGGCNVDDSSSLLYGSEQTHPKSKIDLFQRPYVTVPYIGRGSVDSVEESKLIQGERETNRRSVNKLSEQTYMNHSQMPLLDPISSRVTDPTYSVEEVAAPGWVRGGIASRDLTRDNK
jgi:hypothetical protein